MIIYNMFYYVFIVWIPNRAERVLHDTRLLKIEKAHGSKFELEWSTVFFF